MRQCFYSVRVMRTALSMLFIGSIASGGFGQTIDHQHPSPGSASGPEEAGQHEHDAGTPNAMTREASGTAWQPDLSPMYAFHRAVSGWMVMGHGSLFVQYLTDAGERGHDQFGSINWMMGSAQRNLASGRLTMRGMMSLEPWTIGGCGYPDLLASGEMCAGETIHDLQHPHDLLMEISAAYDRPLGASSRWQVYAGLAGEPALGPVAFPHRISALANPIAPISHHWLDATHVSFGVVTGGVYSRRWKVESSLFNGREPDEERTGLDLAPLSSASARVWLVPNDRMAFQISGGHLENAEPAHAGQPPADVDRVTASFTYHRSFGERGLWASTVAWGRNAHRGAATHALLAETTVGRDDAQAWFARFEAVSKSAHDLGLHGPLQIFDVSKVQGGYVRYGAARKGFQGGLGAAVSAGMVPAALRLLYGGRVNAGLAVFATVRPAEHRTQ